MMIKTRRADGSLREADGKLYPGESLIIVDIEKSDENNTAPGISIIVTERRDWKKYAKDFLAYFGAAMMILLTFKLIYQTWRN